ncbi:hypothetical protein AQUCO_07400060v1 [Aquilegia coerulea]|uniref:C2H2-type domain-containing protein n=1 Tax=Aquilegia coerulea TaxID=218851 RepID=A0A2G5C9K4_AQUCA|nr:hypothetical protein AQUCO_07400060v1 [Aquilegia coerulea]
MDVDDKKGKKKLFPEEDEKIDTATSTSTSTSSSTTTTTTTTTAASASDMMMDVVDDDDGKKEKKKLSPEEEEVEKLRIEKLVTSCTYHRWTQNQYTLRLDFLKKGNKIVKKKNSAGDSNSICRDENQLLPPRKRVLTEVDAEKHHHHHDDHGKLLENQNKMKFIISLKKKQPDENPNEENIQSEKSSHGHRRNHPRETLSPSVTEMISSPYSSSSPSRSVTSADSMKNSSSQNLVISSTESKSGGLELGLSQWSKKEKRGRRALTKEEQAPPLLHEKDLQGVGDQDIVMAGGKQLEKLETEAVPVLTSTVETQWKDGEVEVANNMATSEVIAINSKVGLDDEKVVNTSAGSDQYKHDGIPGNSNMLLHDVLRKEFTLENKVKAAGGINAMNIRQKKSLITTSIDGTYWCSECNKCFPSHQALGGHKSSHSIKKTKDVPALTNGAAVEHDARYGLDLIPTHQCKICNKSFHSGQALGGHQRSHYIQPMVPVGKEYTLDHKIVPMAKDFIIDLKSAPEVKETTFELKPAPVVKETTFELKPAPVVKETTFELKPAPVELNFDIRSMALERDFDLNELPAMMEGEEVDIACTALSISTPQPIQAA